MKLSSSNTSTNGALLAHFPEFERQLGLVEFVHAEDVMHEESTMNIEVLTCIMFTVGRSFP